VAEVLDILWGGAETLIVISSDLSHYHAYREAMQIDVQTVAAILARGQRITHEQACGATPINGLMQVAQRRGLAVELIDQCNSGDTAGDRQRVVGYASFAVYEDNKTETIVPQWFPAGGGMVLVSLARAALERALGLAPSYEMKAKWLEQPAAVFVTLTTADGALRGCIGSLEAHRTLEDDVEQNAVAAGLRDPRFAPIHANELDALRIEVSLLTAPESIKFVSEAQVLAQLRPQQDGLIFAAAGHRATFLPQVWEQIPAPREFLAQLKLKAGVPRDYWGTDVKLWRYGVAKFSGHG
jgi:MEMO1 family protein